MSQHLFLPGIAIEPGLISQQYNDWLGAWLAEVLSRAEAGDIAMSECLAGAFLELALNGRLTTDWTGVIAAWLTEEHRLPIAYSEQFGHRLYGFDAQYKQVTVQSIHTRWWIECITSESASVDHEFFASALWDRKRTESGLIYDFDISPTILRHRMKTEITMSAALAVEILSAAGRLSTDLKQSIATDLVDPKKCPVTPYMSAEYFRLRALEKLDCLGLFPVGVHKAIQSCATDLPVGFCDFCMSSKFDAYMGTAKRTGRDKPVHSPLAASHAAALLKLVPESEVRSLLVARLQDYATHLKSNPMDIPPFQMRDVPIPFGADGTPIEILAASHFVRA
jgi:hypothetical protein